MSIIKGNIVNKDNLITVDKNILEEYSTLIDVVSHERDKLFGNYIESSSFDELTNYLDR